jgi:RHS repeat-associated protein
VGRRVALKRSTGEVNYYSEDHLGSTTIVTDATGAKVEEIYYYPYGGTRSDTGSVSLNHKYTGQELDSETNLYYYGARYYDAVLARFISADSIVFGLFDPQSLNRYSYVRNNPARYIDPSGNQYESYDPNLWLTSIYGPLGSFGSMFYSNLGSSWKLDINIPNFNINSFSNIGFNPNFDTSMTVAGNNLAPGPNRLSFGEIQELVQERNMAEVSDECVICIAYRESRFDPNAQSGRSTARGLMGVTRPAANQPGVGYNYDWLFDPGYNIEAGTRYLQWAIDFRDSVQGGLDFYRGVTGSYKSVLGCESCLVNNPKSPYDCFYRYFGR